MKVRIQGNSLRFRLKQFEVAAFRSTRLIKEEVVFGEGPSARLQFILKTSAALEIDVVYEPGKTTIVIPQQIADDWTGTEAVGFGEEVVIKTGKRIKILIEKDFKCLDGAEEEIGSYPNPKEAC